MVPPRIILTVAFTKIMALVTLLQKNSEVHVIQCSVLSLGRVAQSVGHLTRKSGVLDSIPGLATYFRFSFRFFQEGQLSVSSKRMCTKYWSTA